MLIISVMNVRYSHIKKIFVLLYKIYGFFTDITSYILLNINLLNQSCIADLFARLI